LAAVREGDTLVVPKLDRLARSVPDAARAIGDSLAARRIKLSLGGQVYDPADPMGKMFFNILATFAEFEVDLLRMRTREGMAVARAKGKLRGKLRGKQPKLSVKQQRELVRMYGTGEYTIADLAEVSPSPERRCTAPCNAASLPRQSDTLHDHQPVPHIRPDFGRLRRPDRLPFICPGSSRDPDPCGIAALWSALARVREQAWALGAAPAGPLTLDFDATLVEAHSDKQGFGFHPLGCWLDRGDGTGEALAGILRPGNAGANTAADHLDVLAKPLRERPILVRADSAGATHAFVNELVRRNLWFSIGFDCDQRVQQAILALPEQAWQPALDPDGRPRRGAWVAELSSLNLASAGWPEGTLAVCRRERAHPGATHKMAFTDASGHRFQVFITNQPDPDPAILEARHRPHAHMEDRIRTAKASGLATCPSGTSAPTTPGSPWS
jgi:hypothetical protein